MRSKSILVGFFLVCFSCFEEHYLYAAPSSGDSTHVKRRDTLIVSIDFMSSAIYSGRNYGIQQIGLNPSIIYHHKSGLTFSVYSYGMGKTQGLITLTDLGVLPRLTITPGYDYLYNRLENNEVLFNALTLGVGMNLKMFSVSNFLGFSFGGGMSSWYEELSLSKYINVFYREKASLAISPTCVGIMGTKFSQTLIYNGEIDTTTSIDSYDFLPLCIGLQLPVIFTYRSLSLTVSPHYDIPLNIIRPTELSLPGNPFYVTCKLSYTLGIKNKRH
ncbi:MAG: hypothetical protein NTW16_09360 [Bacteroidetes bacterium]|nr:hypothetical protein [Bacteroidota bacterium]